MKIAIHIVILLFVLSIYSASAKEAVQCPTSGFNEKIFKVPSAKDTSVAIENTNDANYPITVTSYKSIGNGICQKDVIARYFVDGSDPTVDSLFFYKIDQKLNLLTIVHWDVNHRGTGTYGKLYQIYAYEIGAKIDFQENTAVRKNDAMTGFDGYADGQQSTFSLKTAKDVKKALSRYLN